MKRIWLISIPAFGAVALALWLLRPGPRETAAKSAPHPPTRPQVPAPLENPPDAALHNPAWDQLSPDPAWTERLLNSFATPGHRDNSLYEFSNSDLPRGTAIATLLEILPALDTRAAVETLGLLAAYHPIEAAETLANHLGATDDPQLAVAIMQTLRAAAKITTAGGRIDYSRSELSSAFECIQQAFRNEITTESPDPARIRVATAAIPEVFPANEGRALLDTLLEAARNSLKQGTLYPLSESDVHALRTELEVAAVDSRDFRKINAHVLDHPETLADENHKARLLEQLANTLIRDDEKEPAATLLSLIEPADAPDASFPRWLEVRRQITGLENINYQSLSPVKTAALIHSGILVPADLAPDTTKSLHGKLIKAAAKLPDPAKRQFVLTAASLLQKSTSS
ncbi:MAG: hypothetical protein ACQCXQ_06295 [Verrucomicrobiales bacterium]|nr:hypothetical protein [Verrucomicrobiota bacterium JB025]